MLETLSHSTSWALVRPTRDPCVRHRTLSSLTIRPELQTLPNQQVGTESCEETNSPSTVKADGAGIRAAGG
jgi:hypothetical protein